MLVGNAATRCRLLQRIVLDDPHREVYSSQLYVAQVQAALNLRELLLGSDASFQALVVEARMESQHRYWQREDRPELSGYWQKMLGALEECAAATAKQRCKLVAIVQA